MDVTVRYFAAAAEAAGREQEQLSFAAGATLSMLKSALEQRYGTQMSKVLRAGSFLVDGMVRRDLAYPLAGQVDVLPPFAGG